MRAQNAHFDLWRKQATQTLKKLQTGCHPKQVIAIISENLLAHYQGQPLIDPYAVYQHLMDYWSATMQDDLYLIAADGWKAETYRVIEKKKGKDGKPGKAVDKGWACDLIPKPLIVARYYARGQAAIDSLSVELETTSAKLAELEEEHSGDDGALASLDKINAASVKERIREIGRDKDGDKESEEELRVLNEWQKLAADESTLKKKLKDAEADLDASACAHYPALSESEIKTLVVDDKWLAALDTAVHGEMDRVSQAITRRVKELAERYETPLPRVTDRVAELEAKVNRHLEKMGFAWK